MNVWVMKLWEPLILWSFWKEAAPSFMHTVTQPSYILGTQACYSIASPGYHKYSTSASSVSLKHAFSSSKMMCMHERNNILAEHLEHVQIVIMQHPKIIK